MTRDPFGGRGPEPEGVDGEDGVEGVVESGRKLIGRGVDQGDPAGPDGGSVAPGRLPEHHAGMVDAIHVTLAAAILLYSDAGFTLAEQKALMAPRDGTPGWRQLAQRKLAELDEQIARAQAAREAIRHGLRCPHEDIAQCPNFNAGITARLAGQPLSRSHQQLHGQRFHEVPDSF